MDNYSNILRSLGLTPDENVNTEGSIYFLGIGGIGMSAIARYFNAIGIKVSGYDKTLTPLTAQLLSEGITIHFEDDINLLDKAAQLVVYTPAIPKDHTELNFYLTQQYKVVKRSDVLQAITKSSFNICIAGTHGKTTISSMVAHILTNAHFGCNAFLGGIAVNYDTNFWASDNNVSVVEADEYDRSFLKLSPDIAVISSMDADHLDIYGTAENMEKAFIDFSENIKPGGVLISKLGLKRNDELKGDHHFTYHLTDERATVFTQNLSILNGGYQFDVVTKNWVLPKVILNMGGMHNIENVLAAIMTAHYLKISDDKIREAVAVYRGVKRRFEYIVKTDKVVYIDDYAHHPEELRALITGAKKLFPNKKCIVIFQPHLFSRTKDLADGFAEVLDLADEIILLPVYPARELPVEGVNSEMILMRMRSEDKMVISKDNILKHLQQEKDAHVEEGFEGTLIITAGAGDIDTLVNPIKLLLSARGNKS